MSVEKSGSMVKEILKNLCCNNGWSYGVLWGFNQENSLLLTLREVYHEEQVGVLIDEMRLRANMLGEGVIDRAAFTKKHKYIYSDVHSNMQKSIGSAEDFEVYQDHFEFGNQFSAGIKTISVIPLEQLGVLQFGSFQKLPETMEFVEHAKALFTEMGKGGFTSVDHTNSSPNNDIFCPNGLFTSVLSGANPWSASPVYMKGPGEEQLLEATFSLANLVPPFPSSLYNERVLPVEDQLKIDGCVSNIQPQQYLPHNTSNYAIDRAPCSSLWSCGDSAQTSSMQNFSSQMRPRASHSNMFSNGFGIQNVQDYSTSLFCSGNRINNFESTQWLNPSDSELQGPASLNTFEEIFQEDDITNAFSRYCPLNEFSQLLSAGPDQSSELLATTVNNNLSHEIGANSVSSNIKERIKQVSESHPSNSVQSSITNVISSVEDDKCAGMSGIDRFLGYFGEPLCRMSEDWNNFVSNDHVDNSMNGSKCISKPPNTLFSSLGISRLLDDVTSSSCSVAKSSLEDQSSSATKRRKVSTSLPGSDIVNLSSVSRLDGSMNAGHPSILKIGGKSDAISKPQTDSLIGDSNSLVAGKISQLNQIEQPARNSKKKAKPGTRPRPKDRQQIHDRLLELRKLIPNTEKMSIDCLLHRTIKHLLFLRSVTEHAERIKQVNDPKDTAGPQDTSCSRDCGVTWACEVGDQSMVCPLIVEDLNTPGQMSIQIQCEEHGCFLEIVEIIRGFGLTILKGLMEAHGAKICARFTVAAEGNRHVTRHEIFSSLVQLLQFSNSSGLNPSDQFDDIVNGGAGLFNTFQQSGVQLPVSAAEKVQCACQ